MIDGLVGAPYNAGWKKDIYPAPEYLMESIANRELFIALQNGDIIGAMVLNHQCNEGYREFQYLHTLPMFYEDTGWTDYELYEYVIWQV